MPIGRPSQRPDPKSAWRPVPSPIEATIAAESPATGSRSTRWLVGNARGRRGQPAMLVACAGRGAARALTESRAATAALRERVRRVRMVERWITRAETDLSTVRSADVDGSGSAAPFARHAYEAPARPAGEAVAQPGAPAPTGPLAPIPHPYKC